MMYRRPTFTRNSSFFGQPRRSSTINSAYSSGSEDGDPFYGDVKSTAQKGKEAEQDQTQNQAQEKTLTVLASWRSKMDKLTPKQQVLFLQNPQLEGFQDYVSKLQQAIKKRVDNSKLFEFTRKVKPFYDLVNLVTPIVSATSQSCPVPPSAILSGITCILSLGVRLDDYQARIIETLASMANELSILDKYRTEALFADDPDIQASQINIAADILDFCVTAVKMFFDDDGREKRGSILFLKAQLKDFDATFYDIKAGFQRHVVELDKLITLANSRQLRLIQRDVASVDATNKSERRRMMAEMRNIDSRRALDEKRSQFLKWLPSLPGGKIQEDTYERRVKGTGEWLMEHAMFKYWLEEPASTLLWIHGKPGCGKSHLASRVIHDLGTQNSGPDSALAYLYCSSTQYTVRMDLNSLLGSLLAQLCLKLTSAGDIESIFQTAASGTKESPSRSQMKEWIHIALDNFQSCYIIIDGLDECSSFEDKQLEGFCAFITSLVEHRLSPPHIKVLVFSRPNYQVIDRAFSNFPQIQVDDGANENDIKSYISEKVDEVNLDPSPEEYQGFAEIKEIMLSKAGGTFLWVRLKVKDFRDMGSVDDIKEALQDPVEGLDEIYGQSIQRILGRPKYSRDRALRALLWVANSHRSLSKLELLEALSTKPGRSGLSATQRISRGFPLSTECFDLIVDVDGYYQLIHASLKDFLLSQDPNLADYGMSQLMAHDILAETCLTYLTFEVFRSVSKSNVDDLEKLLTQYPFLDYAAQYWGDHFALTTGRQTESLNKLLTTLLQTETLVALCIDILEFDELTRGRLSTSSTATPLHLLAILNLRSLAETMPELQHHINTHDQFLHLPIDYAMIYEATDMIKWLLNIYRRQDRELFATCLDCCQVRLLQKSIGCDWGDVVESLFSLGIDPALASSSIDIINPFQSAIMRGSFSVLDALLKAGLDLEFEFETLTPLSFAARMGYHEAVKVLIAAGADVGHVASNGWTALHHAAANGNPYIISELIKRGSEIISFIPKHGANALHLAVCHGKLKAVEQLLGNCQDLKFVDALDSYGYTPLMRALEYGFNDVALLILEFGARHDLNKWAQVVPKQFFSELCKHYSDACCTANSSSKMIIRTLTSVCEVESQTLAEQAHSNPETTMDVPRLPRTMPDSEEPPEGDILYQILLEALASLVESRISQIHMRTLGVEEDEQEDEEDEEGEEDDEDDELLLAYHMSWRLSRAILGRASGQDFLESARIRIKNRLEMKSKEAIAGETNFTEGDDTDVSSDEEESNLKLPENKNDFCTKSSDLKVIEGAIVETSTQDELADVITSSGDMQRGRRETINVRGRPSRKRIYKYERRLRPHQRSHVGSASGGEQDTLEITGPATEIAEHLVIAEAIDKLGYEFERSSYYYYIQGRLSYEEAMKLIELSDQMRSAQARVN